MTHYVIVGNGVAGLRAVEVIRKRDGEGKITLPSDEPHPFYYRPQLADYVGGLIEESSLWTRSQDFFARQQITPLLGKRVVGVDPERRTVLLEDGGKVDYEPPLLAPGGYFELPAGGALCPQDPKRRTERLRRMTAPSEQALVGGEGLFGLEAARGLRERGLKVSYLLQKDRFWPEALEEVASELVTSHLQSKGVEVLPGTEVEAVWAPGGRVQGVSTSDGRLIKGQVLG